MNGSEYRGWIFRRGCFTFISFFTHRQHNRTFFPIFWVSPSQSSFCWGHVYSFPWGSTRFPHSSCLFQQNPLLFLVVSCTGSSVPQAAPSQKTWTTNSLARIHQDRPVFISFVKSSKLGEVKAGRVLSLYPLYIQRGVSGDCVTSVFEISHTIFAPPLSPKLFFLSTYAAVFPVARWVKIFLVS